METNESLGMEEEFKVTAVRIATYLGGTPELALMANLLGAGELVMAAADLVLFECRESCGDKRCWARDVWDLLPTRFQEKLRDGAKDVLAEYRNSLN